MCAGAVEYRRRGRHRIARNCRSQSAISHTSQRFSSPGKDEGLMNEDKRRRRALMVFQIAIYGYLLLMFGIQVYMYATRDW
jgi:hypothetical protein